MVRSWEMQRRQGRTYRMGSWEMERWWEMEKVGDGRKGRWEMK